MLTTTYHAYHFDVRDPDQAKAWAELKARLKAQGLRLMESHGGGSHYRPELDGRVLTLETAHLFDNQWNTAPVEGISDKGLRVFDWAKDAESSIGAPKNIKRGHYLDQTEDMRRVRRETVECGYCGHQEPSAAAASFCDRCIGSEYLKASDLRLLRLRPVDVSKFGPDAVERGELTDGERAVMLPRYREAQMYGNTERDKSRLAKQRASIIAKAEKATRNAAMERDGFLWFMDRGISVGNLIFYDHTGRFCFGWRKPVDAEVLGELLDVISEFPFPYEIKTADGRSLSGNIG